MLLTLKFKFSFDLIIIIKQWVILKIKSNNKKINK